MKWNSYFYNDNNQTLLYMKMSLSKEWVCKHTTLVFLFGQPPWMKRNTSFQDDSCQTVYHYKKIHYLKSVFAKNTTLVLPFIKGSSPRLMKWNPSTYRDYYLNLHVWKTVALWKVCLQDTTIEFLFWRGHSRLMNEIKPILPRRLLSNFLAL